MPIYFWKANHKYGCFCQWYYSNFTVYDITYNCCQQYMMYHKALLFADSETAQLILEEKNSKKQKDLGRKVKNFSEDIWNNYKETIVFLANFYKFSSNNMLREILLSTKNDTIFHASPHDTIWGIGITQQDAKFGKYHKGQNLLGKSLQIVRSYLQSSDIVNTIILNQTPLVAKDLFDELSSIFVTVDTNLDYNVNDSFLRSIMSKNKILQMDEEMSESTVSTLTSRATSSYTVIPTIHGNSRMCERKICLRELQAAKKHGKVTSGYNNALKYEYNGIVYITDSTQKQVITTYRLT